MAIVNLFDVDVPDTAGDRPERFRRSELQIGPLLGGMRLGGTLYDIPPGERISPYHYEYNNEEWLVVLAGTPTLRTPTGEQELRGGDVVAFLEGPEGAHSVANAGDEVARVLMLSSKRVPKVAVYPDSDKLAVWQVRGDEIVVNRSAATDYWDGEAPSP